MSRIACVYLPAFALQVEARRAPHLAGRAVAVTAGERPVVIGCSRAALALGVRPGMPAGQARAVAGIEWIHGQQAAYREALGAIAEVLMACSMTVDIGEAGGGAPATHQAIYVEVPPRRSARFGAELVALLARQGYRGRVGVADDRFTAWAAAVTGEETVTVVPRGTEAAFLAPLPLDLLPLGDEVRPLFRALKIETLGQFAALPPPSVARPDRERDLQEMARGDGPRYLRGFVPRAAVAERVELERPIGEVEPLSFLLRPLAERVCQRLVGRGGAAARVELVLRGAGAAQTTLAIAPTEPTLSSRALLDRALARLSERGLPHEVSAVELRVVGEGEAAPAAPSLFTAPPTGSREPPGVVAGALPLGVGGRKNLRRSATRPAPPGQANLRGILD